MSGKPRERPGLSRVKSQRPCAQKFCRQQISRKACGPSKNAAALGGPACQRELTIAQPRRRRKGPLSPKLAIRTEGRSGFELGCARSLLVVVALGLHGFAAPSEPTFYKNISPILQEHCQSCHRPGEIGPMPLVSYEQVRPWARAIRERVVRRNMPPWLVDRTNDAHYPRFSNDPSLTPAQIQQIAEWADAGAPAGDPHDAPATKRWTDGWNIDPPDVVFQMPKAVSLPA